MALRLGGLLVIVAGCLLGFLCFRQAGQAAQVYGSNPRMWWALTGAGYLTFIGGFAMFVKGNEKSPWWTLLGLAGPLGWLFFMRWVGRRIL